MVNFCRKAICICDKLRDYATPVKVSVCTNKSSAIKYRKNHRLRVIAEKLKLFLNASVQSLLNNSLKHRYLTLIFDLNSYLCRSLLMALE